MAVTLPSDLLVDVMRNADPARRAAAEARLTSPSEERQAAAFGPVLDRLREVQDTPGYPALPGVADSLYSSTGPAPQASAEVFRGFERMVLRNLFEEILPPEDSGAFGTDSASGMWRSMAADQFAGVYAEAGGIGLARILSRGAPQWPYFALARLGSFAG